MWTTGIFSTLKFREEHESSSFPAGASTAQFYPDGKRTHGIQDHYSTEN